MNTDYRYRTRDPAIEPGHESDFEAFVAYTILPAAREQRRDLLDAYMLDALSAELREPLAIIKGAAETLLRHADRLSPEERHEFLSAIVEASDRFEHVLQHFLPTDSPA